MLQSSPPLLAVGISDQTRHSQPARVLAPSLSEVFMMQLVPVLLSICSHCYTDLKHKGSFHYSV